MLWCKSCHPDDKTHKFKIRATDAAAKASPVKAASPCPKRSATGVVESDAERAKRQRPSCSARPVSTASTAASNAADGAVFPPFASSSADSAEATSANAASRSAVRCPECQQVRVLDGGQYVRGPVILGGTRAGEAVYWCKSCHPDDKTHKFKVMADGAAVPHSTRHSTHSTAIASAAAAPILPAAGSTRALHAAAEAAAIICGLDAA